ncbi:unnamed protein product, partial [Rotaria sordida]
MEITGESST